jgi:DNA-binding Xre family transcriptional regulator
MAVTYKKLWIMLIERDLSKPEFRDMADISPSTMTKLNKNMHVAMEILEKICHALDCTLDDIVEILPREADNTKQSAP